MRSVVLELRAGKPCHTRIYSELVQLTEADSGRLDADAGREPELRGAVGDDGGVVVVVVQLERGE